MVSQYWGTVHTSGKREFTEAANFVASVELLSATEMRAYFSGSEIWFERVFGLPKSLVAIRTERGSS
jgi:hypothetical protein